MSCVDISLSWPLSRKILILHPAYLKPVRQNTSWVLLLLYDSSLLTWSPEASDPGHFRFSQGFSHWSAVFLPTWIFRNRFGNPKLAGAFVRQLITRFLFRYCDVLAQRQPASNSLHYILEECSFLLTEFTWLIRMERIEDIGCEVQVFLLSFTITLRKYMHRICFNRGTE